MNINNKTVDQITYDLLKNGLNASSLRSRAIANNIANINTKGYKRQYVTFEDTLKQNIDNVELKTTNSKHISSTGAYGDIKLETEKTTGMREDGNNVDIDKEMVDEAANTLMYNALITQVNSRLSMERYVVNGR